jgi:hypothetical protein
VLFLNKTIFFFYQTPEPTTYNASVVVLNAAAVGLDKGVNVMVLDFCC